MIKTESEYRHSKDQVEKNRKAVAKSRSQLKKDGLTSEQINRALNAIESLTQNLQTEVQWYEDALAGRFGPATLQNAGRLAIAARIFRQLSIKELADRVEMAPANLSRLEANEYHAAKTTTIAKIFDALDFTVTLQAKESRQAS